MTEMEFINSEEYSSQKRLVYFSKSRLNIKNLSEFAHKKAMQFYNNKYLKK